MPPGFHRFAPMYLAQRYLFRQSLRAALVGAPAFFAAMTLTHATPIYDAFGRRLIDLGMLLYMMALWVPMMVYLSMPVVAGLTIGFAYIVAAQEREIAILSGAGLGPGRLAVPGAVAGVLAALVCAAMSLYLLPVSMLEFQERMFLAEKNIGPKSFRENQFNEVRPGIDIYFSERVSSDAIRNVVLRITDNGRTTVVTGKTATFLNRDGMLFLVVYDGVSSRDPDPDEDAAFRKQVVQFDRTIYELARIYSEDSLNERGWGFFERHIHHLLRPPPAPQISRAERAAWVVEGYKRLIHPLLCIGYVLVGVGLALAMADRPRGALPAVVARLAGVLIVPHCLYLLAIGALSREAEFDHRLIFAYPFAFIVAGIAVVWPRPGRRRRAWPAALERPAPAR